MPLRHCLQGGHDAPGRFRPALCQRPAQRRRHGGDPRRRPQARRRSARRRRRALLGADQRASTGCDIAVVNPQVDPTFSFMTVDHDGKIRMDCSSPYAMARLVGLKDRYQVAFANDPDSDRHGIVTPSAGLMNPNHYLAVAIRYLLTHRPALAGAGGGRQDAGQQQHDRPRRAQARPPPLRGAGRLQMVRAGPVRRLVLLRRRGERRRELPAPRRHRLDDRQGRPDHGPAGGRDHRPHRQGPRRALPAR